MEKTRLERAVFRLAEEVSRRNQVESFMAKRRWRRQWQNSHLLLFGFELDWIRLDRAGQEAFVRVLQVKCYTVYAETAEITANSTRDFGKVG